MSFEGKIQITPKTSKSICLLPFIHTYIRADGSMVACCRSQGTKLNKGDSSFKENWNSGKYLELRKSLIHGEYPATCQQCWNEEATGIKSTRQQTWEDHGNGDFGTDQVLVSEDMNVVADPPLFIELKCSNFCNLKCRMCYSLSSFRVREDREIIDKYISGYHWPDKIWSSRETIKSLIEDEGRLLQKVQTIQFSGGEPLISDEHLDLLNQLNTLKYVNPNICLKYATNLTHLRFRGVDYLSIWKHFKKVCLIVSVDGIYDVYDYIRVGSDFNRVMNNLKKMIDSGYLNVSINFTTQAYNVFQLPEFLDYFKKIAIPVNIQLLSSPDLMIISSYPPELRQKIIRKFSSECSSLKCRDMEKITRILQRKPYDASRWNRLISYTEEMEGKYGIRKGFHYLYEKYLKNY